MSAFLAHTFGIGFQGFNNQGQILAGGKLYSYLAGSTTPQATWTSSIQAVQNANPIVLDSTGRTPNEVWVQSGIIYKFVLTDAVGTVLGTWDNVSGVNDTNLPSVSEWLASGVSPTYVNANTFIVPGNLTPIFQAGRRVAAVINGGTVYGTIWNSSLSTNTTVQVIWDGGSFIDATLSSVSLGILTAYYPSYPQPVNDPWGYKNKIVNGDFQVDQYSGGSTFNITAGAALKYVVDRWFAYCTGANTTGSMTIGSSPLNSLSSYGLTLNGAAGVTGISIAQRIEAANAHVFQQAGGISISFATSNNLLSTINWAVYTANSPDSFGTLASPTKTLIASGSITIPLNSTQRCNIAISSGIITNQNGIELVLSVGALTSGQWQVYSVQMEATTQYGESTPFEITPYQTKLAQCRRYYRAQAIWVGASTAVTCFPIDMRATPTLSGGGAGFNSGGTTADTLMCYQTTAGSQALTLNAEL